MPILQVIEGTAKNTVKVAKIICVHILSKMKTPNYKDILIVLAGNLEEKNLRIK